jgi:predicted adenine nucleotide alpha hydrolase (AANH) superfamily ATPase
MTEICKRHNVDHTGTFCGWCFSLFEKKAKKLDAVRKAIRSGKLKDVKKAAK